MTALKKVTLFVLGVATALLFLYVFVLNTAGVEFRFTTGRSVSLPLGVLLIGSLVLGLVLAVSAVGILQAGRSLRTWPARRHDRQTTRVTTWQEAGKALTWEGELQRARSLLERAWRKQPENSAAAVTLASSYVDTGEYDAARRVLARAVAQNAADPDVRLALSEAAHHGGDLVEALRVMETVRLQHPKAPRALQRLRSLYRESGRWQEAADAQEEYVRTLPAGGPVQVERRLLTQLRYQAAMCIKAATVRADALSAVLQSDRTFLPAAVSVGDALVAAGKSEDAVKHWDRMFKTAPHTVLIERILSQQSTAKDRQRTVALMKKHAQGLDADAVHVIAARVALEDGDAKTAVAELEAATCRTAPAVQQLWGRVHRERNELEQAVEALTKAVSGTEPSFSGYQCTSCGRLAAQWVGFCDGCHNWDTYRPVIEIHAQQSA